MLAATTLLLLLSPGADPTAVPPRFTRGDEMVYAGTVAEESRRVDLTNRRTTGLEVRIFVLEATDSYADLAVMTLLQPKEDPNVAPAAAVVTGIDPAKTRTPPAVRLELVRVNVAGWPMLLAPKPGLPLALTDKTETKPPPPMPLDATATLELGFLVPRSRKPPRTLKTTWQQSENDRPHISWTVAQAAVLDGAEVLELAGVQETAKWQSPGGLDKNWRRTDSVWVGTGDGLARQFTRTLEVKDGVHVTEKRTVSCALSSPPSPNRGEGYTAIRKEIEAAVGFAADLEASRGRVVEKLDDFERRHRETPYRAALEAVRRRAR